MSDWHSSAGINIDLGTEIYLRNIERRINEITNLDDLDRIMSEERDKFAAKLDEQLFGARIS